MNKYIVYVKEVHEVPIEVYALSKDGARNKALNLDGEWLHDEIAFDDCLSPETWRVEMLKPSSEDNNLTREQYIKNRITLCEAHIHELKEGEPSSIMKMDLLTSCVSDLKEELALINSDEWKSSIGE
tara:strand:+ start:37620 stop:38000 length:381 start_codon:yes stop_codon:yes gene_type:complete